MFTDSVYWLLFFAYFKHIYTVHSMYSCPKPDIYPSEGTGGGSVKDDESSSN